MQGVMFQDDFLVLPIGSCDVVLGIQWLSKLGDIQIKFEKLYMKFVYQGKQVALQGIQPSFKTVDAKAFNNITAYDAQIFMIRVGPASPTEEKRDNSLEERPVEVQALLEEYHELFQEPRQLLLSREVFDHHIPLKDDSLPVNSRPYRYSPLKKDVIEKMVSEMLQRGIIQYSASSYASPVVFVGKKDGS
ncbi:uncharacterized protein LOC142178871 [Nicotiana tabacum]|uniref:Uncharacterized protein LOC142178871 n=1 Tax=Nicotiana tabacum TaxID=4097 RepID=A0AC58U5J5_TOBAC